jgi:hypothetical protein
LLLGRTHLALAQPDNDLFIHRTHLVGTNLSLLASAIDAGQEPGEPAVSGQVNARTVWWSWTAPADGRLIVNVSAEGLVWTQIHAYSGNQLSSLVEIPTTAREHNVFVVKAGEEYPFQVVVLSAHDVFQLQAKFQPLSSPPANDAFAGAEPLVANGPPVLGSTLGASREAGEPTGPNNTVWYSWTAPADGVVGLEALSPGPKFALFAGTALGQLNFLGSGAGWMEFYCDAGVTYQIRITMDRAEDFVFRMKAFFGRLVEPREGDRFDAEQPVTFRAELTPWDAPGAGIEFWVGTDVVGRATNAPFDTVWQAAPGSQIALHVQPIDWVWPMVQASRRVNISVGNGTPVNDSFEHSTLLTELPAPLRGDARGATAQAGEPPHGYAVPLHTVWYNWTAPSNGLVQFTVSPYEPEVVRFYTGTSLNALQPVTPMEVLGVPITAGITYQIAVDSSAARRFEVWFRYKVEPPDFNDAFAARQTLTNLPVTLTNVLSVATMETGEPVAPNAGEQSLWFTWLAPSNGVLTVRCDYSFVSRELFTGNAVTTLTQIAPTQQTWNQSDFWVQAGTSYQLRISGAHPGDWLGAFASLIWLASFEPVPANAQFENRQLLPGTTGHVVANGHLLNDATLWYEWVAPAAGVFIASPEAFVYSGNVSTNLLALTMTADGLAVTQGMSIKLACRGSGGGWPDVIDYTFFAAPPNDRFTNALQLLGTSASASGHTYGAGRDKGEPAHGIGFAGRTIWYRWTAPGPGWLAVAVQVAGQTPAFMAYEGKALNRLKPLANRSRIGSPEGLFTIFETPVEAAKTYYFVLDNPRYRQEEGRGFYPAPPSTTELHLSFTPLQLQVDISNPAPGTTILTARPSGPGSSGNADPIIDANYSFIFEDRFCSSLVMPASEPDGSLRWTNPPPGQYLVVGQVSSQSGGDWLLPTVNTAVRPDNDSVTNARVLTGYQVDNDCPIGGATRERAEPNHGVGTKGGTVWWQWTAPATGDVDVSIVMWGHKQAGRLDENPPLVPGLGIYTLKQGRLLRVGSARVGAWTASQRFKALAGTNYLIAAERPPLTYLSDCGGSVHVTIRQEALRLVSPKPDAGFATGTPIPLAIEAGFPSNLIARVDYLATEPSAELIASVTQPPFATNWNGATRGAHALRARLTLGDGRQFLSETRSLVIFPPNDDFEHASLLSGDVTPVVIDSSSLSSAQPKEPKDWTPASGTSVWYRWVAPRSGPALLRLGGQYNTVFVYTGETLATLRRVSLTNTPALGAWTFQATAGTTYQIAVVGNGDFSLTLADGHSPSNDTFAGAQRLELDGGKATINGSFRLATYEPGEPNGADVASVWYAWRAPADGTVAFKQPGPVIGVDLYEGTSLDQLVPLVHIGEEYHFGAPAPGKIYRVLRDHEYRLRVGRTAALATAFDAAPNQFQIEMLFAEPPPNDPFTGRTPVSGDDVVIPGNLLGASSEPGDTLNGTPTAATLWWTWVAPADGLVSLTSSNVGLSIFQGEQLGALSGFPGYTFRIHAGQAVHLAAESFYQRFDPFLLHIRLVRPPANDTFSARSQITGLDFFARTNTLLATRDLGEPGHAGQIGGHSIWWSWTAPSDGVVTLLVTNTAIEQPLLAVYQGATLNSLQLVASALGTNAHAALTFPAQRDGAYQIAVDGYWGQYGPLDFVLHLDPAAAAAPLRRNPPPGVALTCHMARGPNGSPQLEIYGAPNLRVRVQLSADLEHWTDWPEPVVLSPEGTRILTDFDETPQRFYRVWPTE